MAATRVVVDAGLTDEPDTDAVTDGDAVSDGVADSDAVALPLDVVLGEIDGVALPLGVTLGEIDGVALMLGVSLLVTELLPVELAVRDPDAVAELVAVIEEVEEPVEVAVAESVDCSSRGPGSRATGTAGAAACSGAKTANSKNAASHGRLLACLRSPMVQSRLIETYCKKFSTIYQVKRVF